MKTLEDLVRLIDEAYSSGEVLPCSGRWAERSLIQGKLYCCGLTAAYRQAGNEVEEIKDYEDEEVLGAKVTYWAKIALCVTSSSIDAFVYGFDGTTLPAECSAQVSLEFYNLGKQMREKHLLKREERSCEG